MLQFQWRGGGGESEARDDFRGVDERSQIWDMREEGAAEMGFRGCRMGGQR